MIKYCLCISLFILTHARIVADFETNSHRSSSTHLLPAPVGMDFFILLCCSSCSDLGFLTVSSIERIVQAASVAALRALTFTRRGSQTKESLLSPIPLPISMPL